MSRRKLFPKERFGTQRYVLAPVRIPREIDRVAVHVAGIRSIKQYFHVIIRIETVLGQGNYGFRVGVDPYPVRRGYIIAGTNQIVRSPPDEVVPPPLEFDIH